MARRFLSAIKLLTGSTPPAGTAGDTFFDTDTKTVQVHDGDAWVNSTVRATDGAIGGRVFTGDTAPTGPVAGDLWVDSTGFNSQSNILRWRKTMSGGETSLSGVDDISTALSYIPGYELVHINGVLQIRGQDYVATTGTTITGLTAFAASDVVDIIAHSNMVYGDYYTQAQSDSRYTLQHPVTNAVTSTTYTLVLGDVGEYVEMNNASANTLTVPLNSSVAFPINTQITVIQTGAGTTTIAPTGGVTINYYSPTSAVTRTLRAQWAAATLIKRATDTWVLIGNLT
jgi:hypothetical protein